MALGFFVSRFFGQFFVPSDEKNVKKVKNFGSYGQLKNCGRLLTPPDSRA